MRPRVFVSSVMEGFDEERLCARRSIEAAGCEPVLIEDYPAQGVSSRNACLNAIDSCDALVLIIGARAGWLAPSGKHVVREEFDYANSRSLPVFVFIATNDKEEEAKELETYVSNYINGKFRKKYKSVADLENLIGESLGLHYGDGDMQMFDESFFQDALSRTPLINQEPSVRIMLAPERKGIMFDPIMFDQKSFKDKVFMAGYIGNIPLFNHECSKSSSPGAEEFQVTQGVEQGYRHRDERVEMWVNQHGQVMCDLDVSGKQTRGEVTYGLCVVEEDLVNRISAFFNFWKAILEEFDPYKRYRTWYLNAFLQNMNMRTLVKERPSGGAMEIMNMGLGSNDKVSAYDNPRKIDESVFCKQDEELERMCTMFRRRCGSL